MAERERCGKYCRRIGPVSCTTACMIRLTEARVTFRVHCICPSGNPVGLERPTSRPSHAFQQRHLPLRLSPDHVHRVLDTSVQEPEIHLVSHHRIHLLWLLEPEVLPADAVFHPRQLHCRAWVSPMAGGYACKTLAVDVAYRHRPE